MTCLPMLEGSFGFSTIYPLLCSGKGELTGGRNSLSEDCRPTDDASSRRVVQLYEHVEFCIGKDDEENRFKHLHIYK